MKKILLIIIALVSFSINICADGICTVYGGTQGNNVRLEKTRVKNTSGLVKVFLSKPEKSDVYVNIRITRKDGEETVVQVRIPKGKTSAEFSGSIDGLVSDYTYDIDSSSCK